MLMSTPIHMIMIITTGIEPGANPNRIGGMGLLPMPSFHTTVRTDPYTAVPSNKLNS